VISEAPVAQFSEKFAPLFQPAPYKVYYGGRSAGRSWGFARALLILGAQKPLRVLCARELQTSITESVHKLLSDQIGALGLDGKYVIQQDRILGPVFPDPLNPGRTLQTEFVFIGIRNNPTKVKSYEGVDICWVEEANKVTRASWDVLLPTIRKAGSEVWITFNPELEKDYTYEFFVKDPPPGAVVVKMNYRDNPWLSDKTLADIERAKARDFEAYLNIWEGHTRRTLEGVVYAKELRATRADERITKVPWDRTVPVDTFWDLGRRDHTGIWFAQRVAMQYRVLAYYEARGEDIHHYLQHCQGLPYTYGTFYLPHDARAKRLGSKRTIEEIVRQSGKQVRIVRRVSVADGINAARIMFPQMWFDTKGTSVGVERLESYRFTVKADGQYSDEPLHDENSDCADAFRYMALSMAGPRAPDRLLERLMSPVQQALNFSLDRHAPASNTDWMSR
jgi:phage terminase large subunit